MKFAKQSFRLPVTGHHGASICLAVLVHLVVASVTIAQTGDFNQDGVYDCADIDALITEIAAGSIDLAFDITGDGFVDLDDRDAWLFEAGETNLVSGNSYLTADANLDGVVDVRDFNVWNDYKFSRTSRWCAGDFNADESVDVSDFMLWNGNKFTSSDVDYTPPPAPGSLDGMVTFAYDPETGLLSMDTGDIGVNCFALSGPVPLDTMELNTGYVDENGSRWLFSEFAEHLKWMSHETTDASGYFELAMLETGLTADDFGEIGFMNQAFETGTTSIQILDPTTVPEPCGAVLLLCGAALIVFQRHRG